MDLGIAGKTALVCGASKGLGRACAEALAAEGVHLVISGRNAEALQAAAQELASRHGVKVVAAVGDITTQAGQDEAVRLCPQPDILVNNAAGPPVGDWRSFTREQWLAAAEGNMVGAILLIRAVIDGMAERGFGRIVNITSLSVYTPIPGLDLSSGARAGLTAFLAGVARTVADRNVTINNMLPGKLDTDRLRGPHEPGSIEDPAEGAARRARLSTGIPAGRLGTPEEFGQICAFLCSTHAGYMTGQNIPVDGGLYVSSF